jgi:CheY-like chemotaxis protein
MHILLVDDEAEFLRSTCERLQQEGYQCDAASNVPDAVALSKANEYDLAIADVQMPGKADLSFVRLLAGDSNGLPVILVTAHPSIDSAIESVELAVVAYLIKPFEFAELLKKVRTVERRIETLRAVRDELARLRDYRRSLLRVEMQLQDKSGSGGYSASSEAFAGMALRSVVESMLSLHAVVEATATETLKGLDALRGPSEPATREVLHEVVSTLERTKSSFKSKELGELRQKLEVLLKT